MNTVRAASCAATWTRLVRYIEDQRTPKPVWHAHGRKKGKQ